MIQNFLFQLVVPIFGLIVFGILIGYINAFLASTFKSKASYIYTSTGFIGTPIHELGHAFFCWIFAHKITEMKLFITHRDKENNVLGYVNHTYNPKNVYQKFGNFFIAIGPIISGSLVLLALLFIFIPETADSIMQSVDVLEVSNLSILNIEIYGEIVASYFSMIGALFTKINLSSWQFWVFLILSLCISLHMNLSWADIKCGLSGCLFFIALLFIADVILYLVKSSLVVTFTLGLLKLSLYIVLFLTLSIIILLVLALIRIILVRD